MAARPHSGNYPPVGQLTLSVHEEFLIHSRISPSFDMTKYNVLESKFVSAVLKYIVSNRPKALYQVVYFIKDI